MDDMKLDALCVCTCDHFAPELRVLVKPNFNRDLAAYWSKHSTSACRVYEAAVGELYSYHSGTLHGFDRQPLDLWVYDENGDDFVDRAFGIGYRNLRRYLARANEDRLHRLSKAHHNLALLLQHGRSIRNCRTLGLCAQRAAVNATL